MTTSPQQAAPLVAMFALLAAAGCASPKPSDARQIDLAAFSRMPAAVPEPGVAVEVPTGAAGIQAIAEPRLPGATGGPLIEEEIDEVVVIDAPSRAPWRAIDPGERMIVESMVGQVNGQPIFADTFFEPIEDELVALAAEHNRIEFEVEARRVISRELSQQIQNALFLAEAQSSLSPEEKQGIFHWMSQVREVVTAGYGGTEAEAERKLLEKEGKTLEGYLGDIEDRELIRKLLRERVASRVIVSWHDVERLYRQRYDAYNPPAHATIARIVLRAGRDDEKIAAVKERLAAGESFLEIAASMGQPNGGIWQTLELGAEGPKDLGVASPEIQSMLSLLRDQGETVGPFEVGDQTSQAGEPCQTCQTWWLHAASVERPARRSIWDADVQRELITEIRAARLGEEQERYIGSLLDRDIRGEIEAMGERLIDIAMIRYAPVR